MFPPVRVNFSLKHDAGFRHQTNHHHNHNQTTTLPGQQAQQNSPTNITTSTTNLSQQQLQLNSRDKYQVLMDILPYDSKRYRYAYHRSSWQQAGKADPPSPTKLFLHPDGPFTLEQLKRQVISFEKIKLTNNDANKHGYVSTSHLGLIIFRVHENCFGFSCLLLLLLLVFAWEKIQQQVTRNSAKILHEQQALFFFE